MSTTPLLRFLRAMTSEQKKQFAADVGTTYVYLHQLAGQPRPNPRLDLAMKMVAESKKWSRKIMTPALTYEDLLTGTGGPDGSGDSHDL